MNSIAKVLVDWMLEEGARLRHPPQKAAATSGLPGVGWCTTMRFGRCARDCGWTR